MDTIPTKRYCPAELIWLKVVSIERGDAEGFRKIRLPPGLYGTFEVAAPPRKVTGNWEPTSTCLWRREYRCAVGIEKTRCMLLLAATALKASNSAVHSLCLCILLKDSQVFHCAIGNIFEITYLNKV